MKEMMRTIILHSVVGVIVFICALVGFNYRITAEKGNPVAELSNSTYPVMEVGNAVADYNIMSGYRGDIDLSLVRNQVTLVDQTGTLELRLHNYDYDITAIQYVLFENSPEEPLEEGTVNRLADDEEENVRTGTIRFQYDLKPGKTYYLRMAVRLDNSTKVYFYTKIQNGDRAHLDEYFTYVLRFHNNLFDKTKMEENAVYLETVPGTMDTSLEHVNIHSDSAALFFGGMDVKEVSRPRVNVAEINDTYAVIQVNAVLSSEVSSGVVQNYDVAETYKLRYTAERMYLLDYERTMGAYYNEKIIDSANSYLGLGIQSSDNVEYLSSDEGHKLAFVTEGQLWYYAYDSSDVSRVYSFTSENLSDLRNDQGEHGIKLLSLDDDGNMVYLVYGYISRGRHEGDNGILIMSYDAARGCSEELAFLVTSVPYSEMQKDVNRLAYLNEKNVFYCVLDGDLHQVDLEEKKDEILVSGMINESLTASKNQSIIAVEKERQVWNNREIEMIHLETGRRQTFSCGENQRIRAIGFLDEDFIYGTALAAEVSRSGSGAVTFPIKEIHIMDIDGNEAKNYNKIGKYILKTSIDGSVLEMEFGKKKKNKFVLTGEKDYIRYKEEERADAVSLAVKTSDVFGEQLYFSFPEYIYIQVEPDLILTKIMSSEDNATLALSKSGETATQYFVYADGKDRGVYTNLPEAVKAADEARGKVIDSRERLLWESVFEEYAMVSGMDQVTKVSGDRRSLAGCLSMIARVCGKNISWESIDTEEGSVPQLLAKYSGEYVCNLNGCTTDEILYYVSKGNPVLARYSGGRYVIVMSYNSAKIRYLDPVTGESTVKDRGELTDTFRRAGNVFYSFLME